MLRRLKNIKPRLLLTHVLVTLGYPLARALTAENDALLLFTDAMTVTAFVLLIGGVVYAMVLRGDFDISGFVFRRGLPKESEKNYQAYREDREEERAEAFNYPLFLGLVYLLAAAVLSHLFY